MAATVQQQPHFKVCSLCGSHERCFCACACLCAFVCHPEHNNLDDCNPHSLSTSRAPVQYTDIPTTSSEPRIGSYTHNTYEGSPLFPPFQRATPPTFQGNHITKANLVLLGTKGTFVGQLHAFLQRPWHVLRAFKVARSGSNRGVVLRRARANQADANPPKLLVFPFFRLSLLLFLEVPQQLSKARQPGYNSRVSSVSLCDSHERCFCA